MNNIETFLQKRKANIKDKRYKNLPEDKTQKLVEYRKNYCKLREKKD